MYIHEGSGVGVFLEWVLQEERPKEGREGEDRETADGQKLLEKHSQGPSPPEGQRGWGKQRNMIRSGGGR